jgi:hypothetical protein
MDIYRGECLEACEGGGWDGGDTPPVDCVFPYVKVSQSVLGGIWTQEQCILDPVLVLGLIAAFMIGLTIFIWRF